MEAMFEHLSIGFSAVLALEPVSLFGMSLTIPTNIVYCLLGTLIGTLIGVLPGLGPVATIAMLLPATFTLPPLGGLIMLAGIYYGSQYGGSTTAILVNLPGETSAVVTCIDGYQMARRGRAGVALATCAIGSFFAGCVGTALLAAFAPPLAEVAFKFGPAEYFSLIILGLFGAVVLSSGSLMKSLSMICLGLLLGVVGTDINSDVERYTFNLPELADGIDFVVVAMGMFGFAEVITNLERNESRETFTKKVSGLFPSKDDLKRMFAPIVRGTMLGSALGILPGGGAVLAAFGAYALEKKIHADSDEFGHGAIEGVAAPESANNAAAQTSFIPLLTLGIPPNAVMALMIGAMMIHNIQPGPLVMSSNPQLFWGLVVSMWVGNLMLVILNLPLIGIWIKLLTIPYRFLYPAILVFCCIGVYTVKNSSFDVLLTAGFGLLGYVFAKLECEGAPLLLGLVLGPLMEEHFRRALLLSHGDFSVFFTRPISLSLLSLTLALVVAVALPGIKARRERAFQEE
ncbi:MAG: tripartite tricarboxylate transporter permease [Candidatus Accumulibacter sp.]|jgi:TctA family transporter|nr:tripartite tricarboxylate transporter permease [Accumulibacter sp.]